MAFQDFDLISERRRAERERKFKKRLAIGAVSAFVLVTLVCAAVVAVVHQDKAKKEESGKKSTDSAKESPRSGQASDTMKDVTHTQKIIKSLCSATTYQDKCQTTLGSAVKENPKISQPKALLQLAISAVSEEIKKALTKSESLKFESPTEKAAFSDCKILINDAVEELNSSVAELGEKDAAGNLTAKTSALNNWLSAVMSYTSNCIDGFNGTKSKPDVEKTFNATQQLTSNSLAIIKELTSVLSAFQEMAQGKHRQLLESGVPSVGNDGLPTWMSGDDRRKLKGGDDEKPTPNVTVAQDGSGKFKTISEALTAMPKTYDGRYVIYVKAGIYEESVTVTKEMVNVTIYGDGSQKTVVTGSKSYADGIQIYHTATFVAIGDEFLAKAMGFRNTAGPEKHQAVAIRVQSDRAIFLNCRFDGYQSTLFAQTHRQYYRGCVITGTIDFIFGDAAAIFQTCLIYIRKPLENQQTTVAAQGREDQFETTGIVLQNCRILGDKDFEADAPKFKNYLGRPWKKYSRTIVMETEIPSFMSPDGWVPWMGDYGLKTCFFAEFENKGPGAKTYGRVKWAQKNFTKKDAEQFTIGPFLQGDWISAIGVPVRFGLFA